MTAAKEPQETFTDLRFPLCGIDLSRGFNQQMPRPMANGDYGGTTPVGVNVRAYEPGTQRARGGQRPGLAKYITGLVGSANLIQELNIVVGVGYTPPGPGGGGAYLVQVPPVASASASAALATFGSPVTAGSAVIVATVGQGAPTSIVDGNGNTYTRAITGSGGSGEVNIYYCVNVAGGFTGVTVNYTGTLNNGTWAFEVGGLNNASPVDQTASNSSSNSGTGTYGTLTTTVAGDILLGVSYISGSPAFIASGPTGFGILTNANNNFQGIYLPGVGIGTYTPAFTNNQVRAYIAAMVAFAPAV